MVTRAVTQLYDDVLRPSGLRVTQFSILATIGRIGEANLKQLEDTLAIDQTTLTRSLNLLERDGVIERASHPDARIRAMKLTSKKGEEPWRPRVRSGPALKTRCSASWVRRAWADAQRRLVHLLYVAVKRRGPSRGRSRVSAKPRTKRDGSGGRAKKLMSIEGLR